jgi:hypothetical protein
VNGAGGGGAYWGVSVEPTAAGSCQVEVTFADGNRSTTDITFVASLVAGDSCCRSGTAITPTVLQTEVETPDDACGSQPGPDASLIGGDGAVRGGDD